MAKKVLGSKLAEVTAQMDTEISRINGYGLDAYRQLSKPDVLRLTGLRRDYQVALKTAKDHLAGYEKGWSKKKGRLSPTLAAGRKKFEQAIRDADLARAGFDKLILQVELAAEYNDMYPLAHDLARNRR